MSSPPHKNTTFIYKINASGKNGLRGIDAITSAPLGFKPKGGKGSLCGDHGSPGMDGINGKDVYISIFLWQKTIEPGTEKVIPIQLRIYKYEGEELIRDTDVFLELKTTDKIKISTTGGNGGAGGLGGNGHNYQIDSGEIGNGGHGGKGGDGGNGGKVHIEVPANLSYLLSYFDIYTEGGKGGLGGKGGNGGVYSQEFVDAYPIIDGDMGNPGNTGKGGQINYLLLDEQGKKAGIYHTLFDIKIEKILYEDAYPDGIFEFGEEIQIKHIAIQNIGEMPTPSTLPICIRVKENEWLKAEPPYIPVPGNIPARIRKNLFNPFKLYLKQLPLEAINEQAPLRDVPLELEAFLPGTDMVFPLAQFSQTIQVQYPLKLLGFRAAHSLAPGDSSSISWRIENVSKRTVVEENLSQRLMQTRIKIGEPQDFSATLAKPVSLADKQNHVLSVLAFRLFDIKKEKQFQEEAYFLKVADHADTLEDIPVELSLEIGELAYPELARAIQRVSLHFRITKPYEKTPESDVLLIFHREIDLGSIKEVEKYYKAIGSTVDYWDLSYYGFLDLEKLLSGGRSLLEDFEGKTILLLNFPYKNLQGVEVLPALFLKQEQFHRAVNEFGIEFLLVGETRWRGGTFLQWINLPTIPRKIYNRYRRIKDFEKFLEERPQEGVDGKQGFLHRPLGMLAYPEDNISNRSYEILIRKQDLRWKYKQEHALTVLKVICNDLARLMEEKFPREQFFFIFEYLKDHAEGYWAKIEVKQGPHKIHGANMLAWNLKRSIYEETHDKSTPSVGFFLYLSLSNWEFKEMLQEFLSGTSGFLESEQAIDDARDALMYRIVVEFLNLKSFHSFSTDELKEQLGFFNMVFECNVGQLDLHSPQTRLFGELCVHVLAFIKSQKSNKERLFLQQDEYRLTRLIQEMLESWINRNFDDSQELKRLDKKLWQRNRKDGKLFRRSLREKRSLQASLFQKLAQKENISMALAAQKYYLKEVQSISIQGNAIFSRQGFDEYRKQWERVANKYREIERKEIELIEYFRQNN